MPAGEFQADKINQMNPTQFQFQALLNVEMKFDIFHPSTIASIS